MHILLLRKLQRPRKAFRQLRRIANSRFAALNSTQKMLGFLGVYDDAVRGDVVHWLGLYVTFGMGLMTILLPATLTRTQRRLYTYCGKKRRVLPGQQLAALPVQARS